MVSVGEEEAMIEKKDEARRVTDTDRWIGKRLYAMRQFFGVKPEDVARAGGISKQQLHKCETGKNRIPAGRLVDIVVHVFKISLDFFNPVSPLGYRMPRRHEMDGERLMRVAQEQKPFGRGAIGEGDKTS
ncbi:MAG: helix-turn-helix transcriptional regulator [Alphaproteobacteria bacterium GM7ARS4]|nr:helix-turn-helix transcriptional regulator [Alphaproteobacteria bacterium GM7ARS4]